MNQVFVLCVGEKSVPRSQFLYRDPSPGNIVIAFYFWVVLCESGPIVVDCSFGPEEASRRGVARYRDRRELLAACGVTPEDVKTVFVTHLHYDHWAGHGLFPNATYFIQQREIAFWQGPGRAFPLFSASADLAAIGALEPLRKAGRVKVVDLDWSVAPGIDARLMPGHTPGLQILRVETANGTALIANDTFHFYENLAERKPVQVTVDMLEAVRSMDAIEKLGAKNPELVLAGHDPVVMDRFPAIAPGVVRVG
ncbi:MAG: N-acyl homoserine lactonase family protein [Xanthobacteraceae bacterium]|nr:N-acyl homoserine lactonase family protein [Xanthobacteraceae bacterium]